MISSIILLAIFWFLFGGGEKLFMAFERKKTAEEITREIWKNRPDSLEKQKAIAQSQAYDFYKKIGRVDRYARVSKEINEEFEKKAAEKKAAEKK